MLVDRGPFHTMIFDLLIAEHREIAALLDRALAVPEEEPAERIQVFAALDRLVRAHARAEEEIVFPVLAGSYELGRHMHEDADDHAIIGALLDRIERTPADGPDWRYDLALLRDRLTRHFEDEELVVFPKAHCVISDERAMDLAIAYERDRDLTL